MLVQMCPLLPTRHRHPVTYRVLIYWEFRRAVALLWCCAALDIASHPIATCCFDILFAIANPVFLQHHARMWVCFGSFVGVGMRNNGFLSPGNCYLLPCFARGVLGDR